MRVLHVATELFPLLKLGGLADVLCALPVEQVNQGLSSRVLLPGHAPILEGFADSGILCPGWEGPGRLLLGLSPSGIPIYALDAPELFGHSRNPYEENGTAPARFGVLAKAAVGLALHGDGLGWGPDLLHCHDWPAGLVPAYMRFQAERPVPTLMTVHNAAYQGLYAKESLPELELPLDILRAEGVELHGRLSLLKAGLQYADRINTVSPTYAEELQSPEGGMGLAEVFSDGSKAFVGILNGVDQDLWNPSTDPNLVVPYTCQDLEGRGVNKAALQAELGLTLDPEVPMFGVVSRMDELKGLDLLLEDLSLLKAMGAQLVVLGHGDPALEMGFAKAAADHPGGVAWIPRQDEPLAHRIFSSVDFLVVPSRSEPCGLTQLYALRYGAVPIVRRTGGLADTVVDEGGASVPARNANGITFREATPAALAQALTRAWELYWERPEALRRLQHKGMQKDLGWSGPTRRYTSLYCSLFPGH